MDKELTYSTYKGVSGQMWLVADKDNIFVTDCNGELKSFTFKNGVSIPEIKVKKATRAELYEDTRIN